MPETAETAPFRSGYVSIVGKPNVGKSTFLNAVLGQKLSIITPKAQTTRHRIMGIYTDEAVQIIFCDTPGVIEPKYALHRAMMKSVRNTIEAAEVILWLVSADEKHDEEDVIKLLEKTKSPVVLGVNKTDLVSPEAAAEKIRELSERVPVKESIALSALKKVNTDEVLKLISGLLPFGPPYFDPDQLTDRPERFFVSEIIREKIFLNLKEEVPYSCEVQILIFEDRPNITYIDAEIHTERLSQKGIIIGKQGTMLRKISTEARKDIEAFIERPVYLNLYVRVTDGWKDKDFYVNNFGYKES